MIALQLLDTDSFGIIPRSFLKSLEQGEEENARLLKPAEERRFLISRLMLRQGLSNVLGGDPSSWRFIVGKTGKVSLAHAYGKPFADFSLSYAGNAIAVAISTSGAVGVDLEEATSDGDFAERVFPEEQFSLREMRHLARISGQKRWVETLKLWTRKEACSKLLGHGLALPFAELEVLSGATGEIGIDIETQEIQIAAKPYILSLATRRGSVETIDILIPNTQLCVSC